MTTVQPGPPEPDQRIDATAAEQVLAEAAAVIEPLAVAADMEPLDVPRRLLLVHAHPDDEAISTGATMAKYAAQGALVTLVTCTLGEEGEIVVDDLAALAADRDDTLGQHRISELAAACEALGVPDFRFLGGPGRYRDSGMIGTAANQRPNAFWNADLEEATGYLVEVMREVRPQVVITYNEKGDYGHPDHIRAHDVTVAAFAASGDPERYPEAGEPWVPTKLYYIAMPKSYLQQIIDATRGNEMFSAFWGPEVLSADELEFGVPDDLVTTRTDGTAYHDAKLAAMRAHKSQIAVDGPFFALADGVAKASWSVEHFQLVRGERGPGDGPRGWESDLFAGLGVGTAPTG